LINFTNLKERVEAIKPSDYSVLTSLTSSCPPEKIVEDAYEGCVRIVPPKEEPSVYLIIGFFSPDGFVMEFRGKPVICFGLERFKDFRLFKILFAHEYAHYLLNLSRGEVPEKQKFKWLLLSEGIGTYFSLLAFPAYKLSDHFLFRRDRLNWCQENESHIRKIYCSEKYSSQKLIAFYKKGDPAQNLPARVGKYLGYIAVKKHFAQKTATDIGSLIYDKKTILSLKL